MDPWCRCNANWDQANVTGESTVNRETTSIISVTTLGRRLHSQYRPRRDASSSKPTKRLAFVRPSCIYFRSQGFPTSDCLPRPSPACPNAYRVWWYGGKEAMERKGCHHCALAVLDPRCAAWEYWHDIRYSVGPSPPFVPQAQQSVYPSYIPNPRR